MSRLVFTVLLGALLASATGCRSSCGSSRNGLFTSTNSQSSGTPYSLAGSQGGCSEGCYDAITGRPVPCPPPTMLIPGGNAPQPGFAAPTRPDELPFPGPSDMIPRPNTPFAPPSAAPGIEGTSSTPKGTPVKPAVKQ